MKMEIKWRIFSSMWKLSVNLKRLYRTQKKQSVVAVLAVILVASAYWFFNKEDPFKYPDITHTNELMQGRLREVMSFEKGTGCEMPELNPFSEEAMQFTRHVDRIVCNRPDWVTCYKSECKATKEILARMKNLVCTYWDIMFETDDTNLIGGPVRVSGGGRYTLNRSDHVKVSCIGTDKQGVGVLSSRWFGNKVGFRPIPVSSAPKNEAVNVLIVMFDSTSRNGFVRRMPRSYKVLVEELGAVLMKSYNIVMDGTPGALFPLLTGHLELELPDSRRTMDNKRLVDDKPFIFHLLKKSGYRTAFFEDMPWIGTFQYRFNGFPHPPTDHYMRPFFIEESKNGRKWWSGIRNRHCVGGTPQHCLMLNATEQFFDLDGKKFGFTFIVSITHEDFNMITTSDDDLVDFLRRYREQRIDDTVLIVMGDHGPRFEFIRNTYQGKIEERLPLVAIVLPEKLKVSKPDALRNLQRNSKVLTTHYDMHTTLLDILGLVEYRNSFKVPGSDLERGLSLLEPIPKSRSCAEAGIMPHWCACAKWQNVSLKDPMYKRAAISLAGYIDSLTAETRSLCSKRALYSIEWVMRQSPNEGMLGFKGRREVDRYIGKYEKERHVRANNEYYQAKVIMDPGQAIFEGSMQYDVKSDSFVITERDISRVNALKMRVIILLSSILAAYAGVIKEDCNGVKLNNVYHDLEVLHENLDRPYLLTVDRSTDILYFSTSIKNSDEFKTARINLKTKEFQYIKGINNGFAQTVDQKSHEIYIGGSDGIYKYDYGNDKAEHIGEKDTDIWYIYFKDVLYFSVFPHQFLYTFENGQSTRFKDLEDTKVDNFVIDNDNVIFFTNATGLYSQEKGTKNAVMYTGFPNFGIRGLTEDMNGKVYVCLENGIYVTDKEKNVLDKVLDVDDAFGLAFDNDNNLVFADANRIVRLKPNRSKGC